MQHPWRSRFHFARRETRGFLAWRREMAGAALTIPTVFVALRVAASKTGAMEEVIAIAIGTAIVLIALPIGEFGWNFVTAGHRLTAENLHDENQSLQDEVDNLTAENEDMKRRLTRKHSVEELGRQQADLIREATELIPAVIEGSKAPEEMEGKVKDWSQRVLVFLREGMGEAQAAEWNAAYERCNSITYSWKGQIVSGDRAVLANRLDYPTRHLGSMRPSVH